MGDKKNVYSSVPVKETDHYADKTQPPKGFGFRHLQTLLLFVSLTTGYTIRSSLSVSLVAMTTAKSNQTCNNTYTAPNFNISYNGTTEDVTNSTNSDYTNITSACVTEYETEWNKWNVYRTYDWSKSTQEMILFAFFVGYMSMNIPIGILAQRYGGKIPIQIALGVNGVISILTPWVPIFAGWMGMCACRFLQGMGQAAFFPATHTILGKWAPLRERGRLSTYIYTGSQFGTILSFQFSGLFAGSPSLGWPAIFWVTGVLNLFCLALYSWLGSPSPHEHPTITSQELTYIVSDGSGDAKKRKTPWGKILTSTAVWGLVSSHAGSAVGYIMMLTETPTYMSKVLNVDIKRNGFYSSMPYIAMYLMSILSGYISDYFVTKKTISVRNIRRVANTIGMVVSAFFLIGFGFITNTSIAVVVLVICLGLHSGVHVGFTINHIDLSPNFAGPIMALSNMVANLTSLIVPVLVSNLVKDDVTNQHRWQLLFIVISGFQILTNVVFVIFVRGEVQPWNFSGDEEDTNNFDLKEKNKETEETKRLTHTGS